MHIEHPVLAPGRIAFRGYQANLARIASERDTLVVLPTGMGKTVVALLVIADALRDHAERILVLAPTRPLVEQHGRSFQEMLREPWNGRVASLTGHVGPADREAAYARPGVVCATPQVVRNDVLNGRLDLTAFRWVVFDECHRAVGDYPYAFIGQEIQRKAPQVRRLGLTASPGHDIAKIDEVRHHLGLDHVEIRTPHDPDVAEYVQSVDMEWETLPLPPGMARVSQRLHEALAERVRQLKDLGFLKGAPSRPRRMDLLDAGRRAQSMLQQARDPDPSLYQALSLQAQAMKLQHAIEQAETQGAMGLLEYLDGLRNDARSQGASKADRVLADDRRVSEAYHIARLDAEENPKLERTATLVHQQLEKDADARVIVFTQYRHTCEKLVERLGAVPGARPVVFVGQGRRRRSSGLTQKQQAATVAAFKDGTHNVLVATSVAEEGLDIPETDLVVFYEPLPSEIRSIQRRGRTGRKRAGRVVVLMTKGTQDEAAHWTARRKERQMIQELHGLRAALAGRAGPRPPARGQTTLDPPAPDTAGREATREATRGPPGAPVSASALLPGPRIVADAREQSGQVVQELHALGAQVEARRLDIADYVLSDRVAVERKTTKDFVDSLVDGRLFDQLKDLRGYPRAFLVLEGESLFGHRNVAPEALMGALASVTVDYGVPVMRTLDALETARFLVAVAKREQSRDKRRIAIRPGPTGSSDADRQRHLVAGLPGVSEARAEALLEAFGAAAAVFAADAEALAQVDGIGPTLAGNIRRVLDAPFRRRLPPPTG